MLSALLNIALGLAGAWLVNYLSDVLPQHRKLVQSDCPVCGEKLDWRYYLVFSPCRECGSMPSRRHWVVVFALPVFAVLVGYFPAPSLGAVGGVIWLIYFSLIVVIDLEHRLILQPISLLGAALGLAFGVRAHGWIDTLIGAAAGFGIMLLFFYLGELFVRFLSKRRGEEIQEVALGFGDVNLSGVMGTLLGWPGVIAGLVLTILLGGLISGLYMLVQLVRKKYHAYQALPYGPFIVISTLLLLFLADRMV